MSTDRQDLRNLCRRRLGDTASPYSWSDLQLNQWINDAIAEHSIHFPRKLNETINCATDDRKYDLPATFMAPITIEYPAGEDPPQYLTRRSFSSSGFWGSSSYYDIVNRDDKTDVNEIWISEKPTTGEDIEVIYSGEHDLLDDDSDLYTVLDRHLELIVLFVRWTAYQELATEESSNPDPTSLQSGTLELNAFRAKREYRTKVRDWKTAESESEISSAWSMDSYDRVY